MKTPARGGRSLDARSEPTPPRRRADAEWYKGNTHTHTLNSDGDSTPDEVARWYREHGYQFLVLSDHNFLTSVDGLNALHGADEKFLLIRGEEVTDGFGGKPLHVNGLNARSPGDAAGRRVDRRDAAARRRRDSARRRRAAHQSPELPLGDHRRGAHRGPAQQAVRDLQRPPAGEQPRRRRRPGLEEVWDQILSSGQMIYGIAVDDAHHFKRPWDPTASRPGQGWVVVRAPRLEAREIVLALERGDFYASTGVTLKDVAVTATSLSVTIEPTTVQQVPRAVHRQGRRACSRADRQSRRPTRSRATKATCAPAWSNRTATIAWVQPDRGADGQGRSDA